MTGRSLPSGAWLSLDEFLRTSQLLPTDREEQRCWVSKRSRWIQWLQWQSWHRRRGKRPPRAVSSETLELRWRPQGQRLTLHGRACREALPQFELSRTLFFSRASHPARMGAVISGSENFFFYLSQDMLCGICLVHAVHSLPHFCSEQQQAAASSPISRIPQF